jgi:hypothetical protein
VNAAFKKFLRRFAGNFNYFYGRRYTVVFMKIWRGQEEILSNFMLCVSN